MRVLVFLLSALLLTGWGGSGKLQPDLPPADGAVQPKVIYVDRLVYVPVPGHLTRQEPVPEGAITQCFDVAAKRRAVIVGQNARFKAIAEIQGTEVKP